MKQLALADRLRLGTLGLTTRKGRTALSTLGIAIGITALVSVLGLSESSRADLNAQLDRLGTNLLTVAPGQSMLGTDATLPEESVSMISRVPAVRSASAVRRLAGTVRRNDHIPAGQTGGISVAATDLSLVDVLAATIRTGRWLDAATGRYPAIVLGSTTARRLAVADPGVNVWLDGHWFTVIGILDPVVLAPEINEMALIGTGAATILTTDPIPPTAIYTRADPGQVVEVRPILARTANPAAPNEVTVSRPSDALAAQAAADQTLTTLTLGLGVVALLVGGIGIANVMVISVLERRREIGVRRALGATKPDIAGQFLTEAVLLALVGGATGALLGVAVTAVFAVRQGWMVVMPWAPVGIGLGCALAIGTVVGIYPALRAAAIPPTEALRTG